MTIKALIRADIEEATIDSINIAILSDYMRDQIKIPASG